MSKNRPQEMTSEIAAIRARLLEDGWVMLWVIPSARADMLVGIVQGEAGKDYLKLKVRAMAEDGKANQAVIALLAGVFELPASRLAISHGSTSRFKRLTYHFS
jgi:uncharacterized protein